MDGEVGDFDGFVATRGAALLRFAYVLCGDADLAQDLVQEALVKTHRHWDRVAGAEHPDAYVRRIVVNNLTSWRRRRSSSEVVGPVPERAYADPVEGWAERDVLWQALAGLPRRQRVVLVLRYYEQHSDAQIAEVLGLAESSVRSLAARAFAALRTHPELAGETVGSEERS